MGVAKPFPISKQWVWEAYLQVKANGGTIHRVWKVVIVPCHSERPRETRLSVGENARENPARVPGDQKIRAIASGLIAVEVDGPQQRIER